MSRCASTAVATPKARHARYADHHHRYHDGYGGSENIENGQTMRPPTGAAAKAKALRREPPPSYDRIALAAPPSLRGAQKQQQQQQQQHSAHPGVRVAAAGGGGADYASEGEDGDGDGDLHRSLARFQASLPKYYQQI